MKSVTASVILFNLLFVGLAFGQPLQTVRIDNDTKELDGQSCLHHSGKILLNWNYPRLNRLADGFGFVFLDTSLGIYSQYSSFGYSDPNLPPPYAFEAFQGGDVYGRNPSNQIVKYDNQGPIRMTTDTLAHPFPVAFPGNNSLLTLKYSSVNPQKMACSLYKLGSNTITTRQLPVPDHTFPSWAKGSEDFFRVQLEKKNGVTAVFMDTNFALIDSFYVADSLHYSTPGMDLGVVEIDKMDNNLYLVKGGYLPLYPSSVTIVNTYSYILDRKTGDTSLFMVNKFDSIQRLNDYLVQIKYSNFGEIIGYGNAKMKSGGRQSSDWIHFKVADTAGQELIDTLFQFVPGRSSEIFDVVPLDKGRYILIGSVIDYGDSPSPEKDLIFQKIDLQTWKPVGLEEAFALAPLSVFPIPAQNILRLKTPAPLARYRLLGREGQILASGEVKGKQIPVAALPPGTYLLEVQSGQGDSWIKKVQIAR